MERILFKIHSKTVIREAQLSLVLLLSIPQYLILMNLECSQPTKKGTLHFGIGLKFLQSIVMDQSMKEIGQTPFLTKEKIFISEDQEMLLNNSIT